MTFIGILSFEKFYQAKQNPKKIESYNTHQNMGK